MELLGTGQTRLAGTLLTCEKTDADGRCIQYLQTCEWPGECLTESPPHPAVPGRKKKKTARKVVKGKPKPKIRKPEAREYWNMDYREFVKHVGNRYTAAERFGLPSNAEGTEIINPDTGTPERGTTWQETVHSGVIRKAIRERKQIDPLIFEQYPDLDPRPKPKPVKPPPPEPPEHTYDPAVAPVWNEDQDIPLPKQYNEYLLSFARKKQPGYTRAAGKPLEIPGFERFQFVLHRSIRSDGKRIGGWGVAEVSTGLAILGPEGLSTQANAMEAAKYVLNKAGSKQVETTIASRPKIADFSNLSGLRMLGGLGGALLTCLEWQVIGTGAIRCKKYAQTCAPGDTECLDKEGRRISKAAIPGPPPELELSGKEEKVFKVINENPKGIHIDHICEGTGLAPYDVSAALVMLELKGAVRQRAGKMFEIAKPEAEKMPVVKRVKFPKESSEGRPATDRQIEYLTDLFTSKKAEGTADDARDTERAFWVKAKLPKALSFWEASNLIEFLKNRSAFNVYQLAVGAVKTRMEKKKVTSADTNMALLAFSDSASWIAEELRHQGKAPEVPKAEKKEKEIWQITRAEAEKRRSEINDLALKNLKKAGGKMPPPGKALPPEIIRQFVDDETAEEYRQLSYSSHKRSIQEAIKAGVTVPTAVIRSYPDLIPEEMKPKFERSWMKTTPLTLSREQMSEVMSFHTKDRSRDWQPGEEGYWYIPGPGHHVHSIDKIGILAEGRKVNVFSNDVFLGTTLCQKARETEKAIMFRFTEHDNFGDKHEVDIWIPRSQMLEVKPGIWILEEWIVREKFGIGPEMGWPVSLYRAMGAR